MHIGVLVRKPEGKWRLRIPVRRLVENIKLDLQEIGLGVGEVLGLDSSGSGQKKLARSCERGNEASDAIQCREFLENLRHYSF
jgi:hypothetical protein